MSRVTWKDGAVVSFAVKGKVRVLAQMLRSPFVAIFNAFTESGRWDPDVLVHSPLLFCTAITNQFLRYSNPRKEPQISPSQNIKCPEYWIKVLDMSGRTQNVWSGTQEEIEVFMYGAKPGASLVKKNIYSDYSYPLPVVQQEIALGDDETIDKYETDGIQTFPFLNERLYLCYKKGRNVDPEKDLMFDRPLDPDFKAYVYMMDGKGTLAKWGYSAGKSVRKRRKSKPRTGRS